MSDQLVPASLRPLSRPEWLASVRQTLAWGVRAVGFWLAVTIPFLYLPLLVRGFSGRSELFAFGGLVALNVAALVVGHDHRQYGRSES